MTSTSEHEARAAAGPDAVRDEFRAWLDEQWDPSLTLVEWRQRLTDSGWAAPHWPERWFGRGLAAEAADVVGREISRAGAVGLPIGVDNYHTQCVTINTTLPWA